MMNNKIAIILILLIFVLAGAGAFYSYAEFGTPNFFAVAGGLLQIALADKEYIELAENPRVILAQPDASLESYMAEQGYIPKAGAQLGSLYVFTNGEHEQHIHYSVNGNFSKWSWQE